MEGVPEIYRQVSLDYCNRLLRELKRNQEDSDRFFGGELHKAYRSATDQAESKLKRIQAKLRNL